MMKTEITWLGHSCFRIERDGFAVIIDPYEKNSVPGYAPLNESADLVLTTHGHFDHNAVSEITLSNEEKDNPFKISSFRSYHDSKKGLLRGKNTIYLLDDGTSRIVHMGDIGCTPSKKILEEIKNCDVLLIPVGGTYTVTAAEAVKLSEIIGAKTTVPMHFSNETFGFGNLQHIDEFKREAESFFDAKTSSAYAEDMDEGVVILEPKYSF